MRAGRVATIAGVGLILATGGMAQAAPITMQMGGMITYSDHPALTGMSVGDAWSITYTFDSNAVDQNSEPVWGQYHQDAFSMTVGGQPVELYSLGEVGVGNNYVQEPGIVYDVYGVGASLAPFHGQGWPALGVSLADHTQSVFSSDSLPLSPLPLSSFDTLGLQIRDALDGGFNVQGSVTYWTPEPATLSLLALGGLAVMRRRRR